MNVQISGESMTLVTIDGPQEGMHLGQCVVQDVGVAVAVGDESLENASPI